MCLREGKQGVEGGVCVQLACGSRGVWAFLRRRLLRGRDRFRACAVRLQAQHTGYAARGWLSFAFAARACARLFCLSRCPPMRVRALWRQKPAM